MSKTKDVRVTCPICLMTYLPILRVAGDQCRDYSQDQERECVGRVIPTRELEQAEWRYVPNLPDPRPMDHSRMKWEKRRPPAWFRELLPGARKP